jgi:hypothetical protein
LLTNRAASWVVKVSGRSLQSTSTCMHIRVVTSQICVQHDVRVLLLKNPIVIKNQASGMCRRYVKFLGFQTVGQSELSDSQNCRTARTVEQSDGTAGVLTKSVSPAAEQITPFCLSFCQNAASIRHLLVKSTIFAQLTFQTCCQNLEVIWRRK